MAKKKYNRKTREHYDKAYKIFLNNLEDGWNTRHSLAIRCDVTVPTIMNWLKPLKAQKKVWENALGEFRTPIVSEPTIKTREMRSQAVVTYFRTGILPEMVRRMEDVVEEFDPMGAEEKEDNMVRAIEVMTETEKAYKSNDVDIQIGIVKKMPGFASVFMTLARGTASYSYCRLLMLFRQAMACMRPYL